MAKITIGELGARYKRIAPYGHKYTHLSDQVVGKKVLEMEPVYQRQIKEEEPEMVSAAAERVEEPEVVEEAPGYQYSPGLRGFAEKAALSKVLPTWGALLAGVPTTAAFTPIAGPIGGPAAGIGAAGLGAGATYAAQEQLRSLLGLPVGDPMQEIGGFQQARQTGSERQAIMEAIKIALGPKRFVGSLRDWSAQQAAARGVTIPGQAVAEAQTRYATQAPTAYQARAGKLAEIGAKKFAGQLSPAEALRQKTAAGKVGYLLTGKAGRGATAGFEQATQRALAQELHKIPGVRVADKLFNLLYGAGRLGKKALWRFGPTAALLGGGGALYKALRPSGGGR